LAAALLVLLAACTPPGTAVKPGPSTYASMPGMPPSAPASTAPAVPVASDSVVIRNFAFSPAMVTVRSGTTVTWTNADQDAHTVTATGGAFKSAPLNVNDVFRYTFTRPGRYDYLCSIHPFMTATVVVTS
jgi:plastocyanin